MEALVRVGMPLTDFIRVYDTEGPFELINGEMIRRMPSVAGHTETIDTLYSALKNFASDGNLGIVRVEATFIMPDSYDAHWVEGSRIPDILFITAERLATYKAAVPDWKNRPYALVPDLVVEVVSPNDTYSEVDVKVDMYLADGVRLVWVLDPQRRKVSIQTVDDEVVHQVRGDATLEGGEVLPGFQIKLSALFG